MAEEKPIGKIIHYYSNLGVAALILSACFFISPFVVRAQEIDFSNEPPFDSSDSIASNPITPSNLSVIDITADSVSLSWTKNPDPDFAYYLVLRITSLVPPVGVVAAQITDRNRNYFTDTLPQGTTYYYQIRTYNQAGQFVRSNTLGALYVPYRHINIDGSISDWSGQAPSIQDYLNDKVGSVSGTDISNVYLAHDNQYFYVRMDLADGSPNIQDIVYYSLSLDSQQAGHSIGDKYLRSQFFPGPEQNQAVLKQRTSLYPHQAVTIAVDIAARGTNTLEMRTPLNKLNGGLLYFYARASTDVSAESHYDGTIQLAMKIPRIFPDKAVSLAKDVLGAPYLWGGKGYDFTEGIRKFIAHQIIRDEGYRYWNFCSPKIVNGECKCFDLNRNEYRDDCGPYLDANGNCKCLGKWDFGKGLDCSGLSFWSYNRAFYGENAVNWGKCVVERKKECPISYEGAHGQYENNIYEITKEDLRPGDLLFFDINLDKTIDHVAMYIGNNEIIHAEGVLFKKIMKENIETVLSRYAKYFKGFGRVKDARESEMQARGASPIELVMTDPEGITITRELREVPGMYYHVFDLNNDGELDDIVDIPKRKLGEYLITTVPKLDALPTDTYTLEIETLINGEIVTQILAQNISIIDIPRTPYIIRSTETEVIPIIPAFIDFDPDVLNLKSRGKWVTVYLELPKGYDINQIDLATIRLNNQIPVESKPVTIGDYDGNGIPDLMVKFNREVVQNILNPGEKIKITISGNLTDGRLFEGSDMIKVISAGKFMSTSLLPSLFFIGLIGLIFQNRQPNSSKRFSKISLLLIFFISILLISSGILIYHWQATKKVITEKPQPWETYTYRGENYGFEIDYPTQGWEFEGENLCRTRVPQEGKEKFCIYRGPEFLKSECHDLSWKEIFASGEFTNGKACIAEHTRGGMFREEILTTFGTKGYKGEMISPLYEECTKLIIVYLPLEKEMRRNGLMYFPLAPFYYRDCPKYFDYGQEEIQTFNQIISTFRFIEK